MIFNQDGLRVATLSVDSVQLRPIKIYRDLGDSVEVESGLHGGDQVILNPPTDIHDGQRVQIAQPSKEQRNERVAADGRSEQK